MRTCDQRNHGTIRLDDVPIYLLFFIVCVCVFVCGRHNSDSRTGVRGSAFVMRLSGLDPEEPVFIVNMRPHDQL